MLAANVLREISVTVSSVGASALKAGILAVGSDKGTIFMPCFCACLRKFAFFFN